MNSHEESKEPDGPNRKSEKKYSEMKSESKNETDLIETKMKGSSFDSHSGSSSRKRFNARKDRRNSESD